MKALQRLRYHASPTISRTLLWMAFLGLILAHLAAPSGATANGCYPGKCDDGNPCTKDRCNQGVCTNSYIEGCVACYAEDPTCNDGNPCTQDSCIVQLNRCNFVPIRNCVTPPNSGDSPTGKGSGGEHDDDDNSYTLSYSPPSSPSYSPTYSPTPSPSYSPTYPTTEPPYVPPDSPIYCDTDIECDEHFRNDYYDDHSELHVCDVHVCVDHRCQRLISHLVFDNPSAGSLVISPANGDNAFAFQFKDWAMLAFNDRYAHLHCYLIDPALANGVQVAELDLRFRAVDPEDTYRPLLGGCSGDCDPATWHYYELLGEFSTLRFVDNVDHGPYNTLAFTSDAVSTAGSLLQLGMGANGYSAEYGGAANFVATAAGYGVTAAARLSFRLKPCEAEALCAVNEDCNDYEDCTDDYCLVFGVCSFDWNHRRCPLVDTTGGTTAYASPSPSLSSTPTPPQPQCTCNEDCDDYDPCTDDYCLVFGVCDHTPNYRVAYGCPPPSPSPSPSPTPPPPECETDEDCDDYDPCTDDYCLVFGKCAHLPNNECTPPECEVDEDCDDGNPCTDDYCSDAGSCQHTSNDHCFQPPSPSPTPPPPECRTDEDCDDGNPCTDDYCLVFGTCDHQPNGHCAPPPSPSPTPPPPECRTDEDCDDGNPCTDDYCLVFGTCDHQPNGHCVPPPSPSPTPSPPECRTDEDCNDANPCTDDICTAAGTCEYPSNNHCVVPPPPSPRCIADSDCDDGNPCTDDVCLVFGSCDHTDNGRCVPSPPSSPTHSPTPPSSSPTHSPTSPPSSPTHSPTSPPSSPTHSPTPPSSSPTHSPTPAPSPTPSCSSDDDCNDGDDCTIDRCTRAGCVHTRSALCGEQTSGEDGGSTSGRHDETGDQQSSEAGGGPPKGLFAVAGLACAPIAGFGAYKFLRRKRPEAVDDDWMGTPTTMSGTNPFYQPDPAMGTFDNPFYDGGGAGAPGGVGGGTNPLAQF